MATTLTFQTEVNLKPVYSNVLDFASPIVQFVQSFSDSLANGTAINQADLLFFDQRAVATGVPDDIDLAGGLTDAFGNTLTFVKVKLIYIRNTSTTAAEILNVGGDATAAFVNWVGDATDVVNIGPDGMLLLYTPSLAGYGVTATTGDILQIAAASGTITYDIFLLGTSA